MQRESLSLEGYLLEARPPKNHLSFFKNSHNSQ
jgi:hypothetical protein